MNDEAEQQLQLNCQTKIRAQRFGDPNPKARQQSARAVRYEQPFTSGDLFSQNSQSQKNSIPVQRSNEDMRQNVGRSGHSWLDSPAPDEQFNRM